MVNKDAKEQAVKQAVALAVPASPQPSAEAVPAVKELPPEMASACGVCGHRPEFDLYMGTNTPIVRCAGCRATRNTLSDWNANPPAPVPAGAVSDEADPWAPDTSSLMTEAEIKERDDFLAYLKGEKVLVDAALAS